jgi:lysophospholipase L1-like esterase
MKGTRAARLNILFSVVMVSVLIAVTITPVSAAAAPSSMAALGDSITTAYNSTSFLVSATAYSWSTGTNTTVNSMYLRFLKQNRSIKGKNYNYGVVGAKMAGLSTQVGKVASNIEYVTILIGANDVCTSSEASMTSVEMFRSQFASAMNSLKLRAPNARVFVVSIPNVHNLWAVLKNNSSARTRWALYGICQSMLANPLSISDTDTARRARVQERNIAFNAALQEVCAAYGPNCKFDNNAVFNTTFEARDVSTLDYFHPSVTGQAKIANVAWLASGFAP